MTAGKESRVTVRATYATLPYGAVTNEETDGWAVIHVDRLEVVGDRLFPSVDEALAAAALERERDETRERANRNFDEEMALWHDGELG